MGKSERSIRLEDVTSAKKITEMNIAQSIDSKKKVTKIARYERMQEIIDSQPYDTDFPPDVLAEVNKLLGTDWIRIQRKVNQTWPNETRHIWRTASVRPDVFEERSWRNHIYPKKKDQVVRKAMRQAIQSDLDEFRASVEPVCESCGATDDLTTDHVVPFIDIASAFIEQHGEPELGDGTSGGGYDLANPEQEDQWIIFHTENAIYQLLCRSCNSSKGTKFQ